VRFLFTTGPLFRPVNNDKGNSITQFRHDLFETVAIHSRCISVQSGEEHGRNLRRNNGRRYSAVRGKLSNETYSEVTCEPVKRKTIGDFFGEKRLAAPGGISSTKRVCKVARQ
jgi:hypothetical protein